MTGPGPTLSIGEGTKLQAPPGVGKSDVTRRDKTLPSADMFSEPGRYGLARPKRQDTTERLRCGSSSMNVEKRKI